MKNVPSKYLVDDDSEMAKIRAKRFAIMKAEVQKEKQQKAKKTKKTGK